MSEKTTEEILLMAESWATRKGLSAKLMPEPAPVIRRLEVALAVASSRKKPPAALVAWLTEALERERAK